MKNIINFKNLEEVKKAYPVDSTIYINGKPLYITGYYFDTDYWWPINVVEGFNSNIKNFLKGMIYNGKRMDLPKM